MPAHYHMLDYIHENGAALRRTLAENEATLQALVKQARLRGLQRLVVSGIGSSFTAARMAEPLFRAHSVLPVHIIPATEIDLYAGQLIDAQAAVIMVSRSGERNWVVEGLKTAIREGALGVAMTGVPGSLLAQSAQWELITGEGQELTFPKTKSVITCAGLMMRLALELAAPGDAAAARRLADLRAAPEAIDRAVQATEPQVRQLAPFIAEHSTLLVSGTASNYGVALESAVKVQEAAYIPTLSDDTGNLLHGPLGPLDARWLAVPLVGDWDLALNQELLALAGKFGAHRMPVAAPGLDLAGLAEQVIYLPEAVDPLLAGLVYLPPMQLLTYYWTLAVGRNPDAPDAMGLILEAILPPGRKEP
jgi:glucosamine--fructose-6-phosphate aminotransferase (isomerizing)